MAYGQFAHEARACLEAEQLFFAGQWRAALQIAEKLSPKPAYLMLRERILTRLGLTGCAEQTMLQAMEEFLSQPEAILHLAAADRLATHFLRREQLNDASKIYQALRDRLIQAGAYADAVKASDALAGVEKLRGQQATWARIWGITGVCRSELIALSESTGPRIVGILSDIPIDIRCDSEVGEWPACVSVKGENHWVVRHPRTLRAHVWLGGDGCTIKGLRGREQVRYGIARGGLHMPSIAMWVVKGLL